MLFLAGLTLGVVVGPIVLFAAMVFLETTTPAGPRGRSYQRKGRQS